jgi:hypothetical protein
VSNDTTKGPPSSGVLCIILIIVNDPHVCILGSKLRALDISTVILALNPILHVPYLSSPLVPNLTIFRTP